MAYRCKRCGGMQGAECPCVTAKLEGAERVATALTKAMHQAHEREDALKALQAERLAEAWRKYLKLFGEPPHGTVKQMGAMLELMPHE